MFSPPRLNARRMRRRYAVPENDANLPTFACFGRTLYSDCHCSCRIALFALVWPRALRRCGRVSDRAARPDRIVFRRAASTSKNLRPAVKGTCEVRRHLTTEETCAQQENEIEINAEAASVDECRTSLVPAWRSEHPDRTEHPRQSPELR